MIAASADGLLPAYLVLKTKISVTAGERTLIRFEHSGDHPTAVEDIHLDVLHREKAPFHVLLDGESLPHYLHRKKYEDADRGWYYSQTLKSVQIKYRNPKHDHEVTVSFAVFDLIGM